MLLGISVTTLVGNQFAVWILVSLLVAYACRGAVRFSAVILPVSRRFRRAFRELEGIRDGREFRANFESVCRNLEEIFSGDATLSREWVAYGRALEFEGDALFSRSKGHENFSLAKVLNVPGVVAYRAAPGVLVGLGLVFTFLGIALVIHLAAESLDLAGSEESLRAMLSAAGMKFWTSLTGVFLSLLCARHYRTRIADATYWRTRFVDRLAELAPTLDQTALLAAIHGIRERVEGVAREAASGIAKSAGDALVEIIKSSMAEISDPIRALDDSVTKSAAFFTDAAQQARSAAGELATAVSNVTNQSAAAASGIAAAAAEMAEQARAAAAKLTAAGALLESNTAASAKKVAELFDGINLSARAVQTDFGAMSADIQSATKSVSKLSTTMGKLQSTVAALSSLERLPSALEDAAAGVDESAKRIESLWAGYERRIEEMDKKLAGSVEVLPRVFADFSDSLVSYSTDVDKHLTGVLERLSRWADDEGSKHRGNGNGVEPVTNGGTHE